MGKLSDLWLSFDFRVGLVAFFCFLPQIDLDPEGDDAAEFADDGDMPPLMRRWSCAATSRSSGWRSAAGSECSGTARRIVADCFDFLSLSNLDILLLIVWGNALFRGLCYRKRLDSSTSFDDVVDCSRGCLLLLW